MHWKARQYRGSIQSELTAWLKIRGTQERVVALFVMVIDWTVNTVWIQASASLIM